MTPSGKTTGAADLYGPTDMVVALAGTSQTGGEISNAAIGSINTATIAFNITANLVGRFRTDGYRPSPGHMAQ